jgi:hypothetical protein
LEGREFTQDELDALHQDASTSAVLHQAQDDLGYYSYGFDVFPGRRTAQEAVVRERT